MPLVTLRLRLTLWYSAVLAWVLALFGLAVYGMVTITLIGQIDQRLNEAATEIASQIGISRMVNVNVIDFSKLEDQLGRSNVIAQVWSTESQLIGQSQNIDPRYQSPLDADALTRGQYAVRSLFIQNIHLRVLTARVLTPSGQLIGYVQTAATLDGVDTARSALVLILAGGSLAAVALSALVGWFSASRALRPLDTITQTALQITRADDLSRRIPLPPGGPRDEVARLALAFNESLERLEKLFNAQRRFLADVSHELRTPLTTIRGNVDLLRRMGGANVDAESLNAIQSEAERMSRLVGDLLLLAQADAGNLPLVKAPLELDTLLLEVFREGQVLAAGVRLSIGEIDQAQVLGDRDRLKQVLLNLVSNALKFTPEGGRVTVSLACLNGWARVTVSDTGPGIPPGDLHLVFERFYRVDKARSRALGGAGLGLSIAQRIAHLHGGRIEVASDGVPGHGATFSVWLPLIPPKA